MDTPSFGFTAKTDEKVLYKVLKFNVIEEVLNSRLSISDYTEKLQKIVFVYLAASPELAIIHDDFMKYRRKSKCIEIGLNLDYELLTQTEDENVLEILASSYLEGIKKFMQIKDFDYKRFYHDVEQLFFDNGFITTKCVA